MSKINTKSISGFMELLPGEQKVFNYLLNTITEVYEQNGFLAMDQPLIDRTESLLANVGGDTTKELMRIARDDEKEQALRFDLTVPLARYVANNYGQLTFPFRRYAIGKVFRGERPQAGRFREFYQADIDIIGNEKLSIRYDAEVALLMAQVMTKLDVGQFTIRINNRKVLNGVFESLGIKKPTEVLRIIDKKEKVSTEEFTQMLNKRNVNEEQLKAITNCLESQGVGELEKLGIENEVFAQGVNELKEVFAILESAELSENIFALDCSVARGLDYYTGTVFETFLTDYKDIGSVCSGGRYENLVGAYTNKAFPGVGTSIGLTRLFDQLMKKEVLKPSEQLSASVVVIVPLIENLESSLKLQSALLEKNIACEVSYSESKLDKRMHYADKLGIPFVAIVGENEEADNVYTLRDMKTGEEEKLNLDEVVTKLSS